MTEFERGFVAGWRARGEEKARAGELRMASGLNHKPAAASSPHPSQQLDGVVEMNEANQRKVYEEVVAKRDKPHRTSAFDQQPSVGWMQAMQTRDLIAARDAQAGRAQTRDLAAMIDRATTKPCPHCGDAAGRGPWCSTPGCATFGMNSADPT